MKRLALLITTVLLAGAPARAATLDLGGYQGQDGAITVLNGGNLSDPYFAAKALLMAREGGLDIGSAARDWIAFALTKQREDGLFDRYCRKADGSWEWETCNTADADDAALALWLELLHVTAPRKGMSEKWKASAEKAEAQLASLYDAERGIYHISAAMPVGLLMDNVEIYRAFIVIARENLRRGNRAIAAQYHKQAEALSRGIYGTFWQESNKAFRITTQERTENAFYPDRVAQIYPWLYNLPTAPGVKAPQAFQRWLENSRTEWLNSVHDDYPWGLVAVTALKMQDRAAAFCWQNQAEPFRYGKNWNVLEDAALQTVQYQLERKPAPNAVACVETTI